jgi:hypothetical protein
MLTLTHGEKIVRKSFNPSEKADVKEAKRKAAELIDFAWDFIPDATNDADSDEEARLLARAIESFEIGAMMLVKALTVKQ